MQNFNRDNILVGERIRSIRESYNMSREKFSEIIDISEVFLGQIERGERSLSIKTLRKKDKVVVEGLNLVKKHQKPNNANESGGIFDIEAPIHVSNVKKVENKKGKN